MVFVRATRVGDKTYYQLAESYRPEGGSPRQRVLLHLGNYSTVEEALKRWPEDIERLRQRAQEARKKEPAPPLPGLERPSYTSPERIERRAEALEAKLKRLREFRDCGEV